MIAPRVSSVAEDVTARERWGLTFSGCGKYELGATYIADDGDEHGSGKGGGNQARMQSLKIYVSNIQQVRVRRLQTAIQNIALLPRLTTKERGSGGEPTAPTASVICIREESEETVSTLGAA